jgi:hypothetical protein
MSSGDATAATSTVASTAAASSQSAAHLLWSRSQDVFAGLDDEEYIADAVDDDDDDDDDEEEEEDDDDDDEEDRGEAHKGSGTAVGDAGRGADRGRRRSLDMLRRAIDSIIHEVDEEEDGGGEEDACGGLVSATRGGG